MPGFLALVLHAHLPFVRHPERESVLEETWLFEAITESYIPLLGMMQRLRHDGVPFRVALNLTPTLCAMLSDELLRERYRLHLRRTLRLAHQERERPGQAAARREVVQFYCDSLAEAERQFEEWNGDLLGVCRALQEAGVVELTASAATHGLLPVLAHDPKAAQAQVAVGCDVYRQHFGAEPAGFWLPECAYTPALDPILQKRNVRWSILDAHAFALAQPRPRRAIYAPAFTEAGLAFFPRDPLSSRQVWSAQEGYPGDPVYRDFYRDVGFDFPAGEIFAEWPDTTPRFTGLKLHRITQREGEKEFYHRTQAEGAARAHAEHFLETHRKQLEALPANDFAPILTMAFDAELFGHWWFEGPIFLEHFIRKTAALGDELRLTTPSGYLARHCTHEVIAPAPTSWGERGYLGVWLDESTAWMYPHLRGCARRMTATTQRFRETTEATAERALRQMARELLLMQASDWAFLIRNGTARDYATARVELHVARFNQLHAELQAGSINAKTLSEMEAQDNLFPDLEWRHFL